MQPRAHGMIDCSFLQVTINSNKLMQILQKLMRQLNEHETQIKTIKEVLPNIKRTVVQNLQALQSKQKLDNDRLELKLKQQIKFANTYILNLDQLVNKNKSENDKKFNQYQAVILKMEEEKNRIQSIINIHQQSRTSMERCFTEQLILLKQGVEKAQKQISQADSNIELQLQMMMLKVQGLIRKSLNRPFDNSIDKNSHKNSNTTLKQNKNSVGMSNFSKLASQTIQEEDQTMKMSQHQSDQFINLTQKGICSKKKINKITKNMRNHDDEQNLNDSRIHKIDAFNQENYRNIQILKNKSIIQQQKLQIISRKLEKINHFLGQFKQTCKKIEDKKSDQQAIQSLKNDMRKMQIQIFDDLDKRLCKEHFDKQKQKILQKIVIIQQNLTEKTDKSDMKKAFIFMQEKIKQIIILIAGDQNDQNDGAIKKMPLKCLSCDKGLQSEKTTPSRLLSPLTQRQNQTSGRTLSKKVRKRIHHSNQNSSTDI